MVALSSHEAAAEDTVPTDVYGRPLVDQLGPIDYRQDGEDWIAIHADGCWELAPPVTSKEGDDRVVADVAGGRAKDQPAARRSSA